MELLPYPFWSTHRLWARTLIVGLPVISLWVPLNHYRYRLGIWNPEYDQRVAFGHLVRMGVAGGLLTFLRYYIPSLNPLLPGTRAVTKARVLISLGAAADFFVACQYGYYAWVFSPLNRLS